MIKIEKVNDKKVAFSISVEDGKQLVVEFRGLIDGVLKTINENDDDTELLIEVGAILNMHLENVTQKLISRVIKEVDEKMAKPTVVR
jgi:hypothetical protein